MVNGCLTGRFDVRIFSVRVHQPQPNWIQRKIGLGERQVDQSPHVLVGAWRNEAKGWEMGVAALGEARPEHHDVNEGRRLVARSAQAR